MQSLQYFETAFEKMAALTRLPQTDIQTDGLTIHKGDAKQQVSKLLK